MQWILSSINTPLTTLTLLRATFLPQCHQHYLERWKFHIF